MFIKDDFENGMVVELIDGTRRLYWNGRLIDESGFIPIHDYDENLININWIKDKVTISKVYKSINPRYFKDFFSDSNLTVVWCRKTEENDKYVELINDIDRVMMAISTRKVEHSKIAHDEKITKPSFQDLDWCYEQLYYLKQNNSHK